MIDTLRALWRGIATPSSPSEDAYSFTVIALAHVLLGAGLAALSGAPAWQVAVGYAVLKEGVDLWRGASWRDALLDALFVALGALYSGPLWWPVTALVAAPVGAVWIAAARGRDGDSRPADRGDEG